MKKYLEVLKTCPLFDGIGDEDLMRMLHCLGARVEFFDKKHTIFQEGTEATLIGIVLSGSTQTVQIDYFGNRSILSSYGRGEIFAEAFAAAQTKSMPVSMIANEPSVIMLISCAHILHTCENGCGFHHKLIYNLMKDLARKTLILHQRSQVTSRRTTREKLLAYLNFEAKARGTRSFDIPFDRQELADYLEVDRSGLSHEISKLRAEGILESRKRHFRLI